MSRLEQRFADCARDNRAALVTYICAGDPDFDTSLELLQGLPAAGADIIELGMPFSDPTADGPTIQAAALRALQGGQNQQRTLELVRRFRAQNQSTPLVLMGYYNPIHRYGGADFIRDAAEAGVDALLVVDLPPEHDNELGPMARDAGLQMIRLATPTTDAQRLPKVLEHASGFLYYVSHNGVTGVGAADHTAVAQALENTADFVRSTYRPVARVVARGGSLREAWDAVRDACDPKFSDYAIYEHCLPFNVGRAYDEARGIDTPRIWTAERDQQMWNDLQGD